MNPQPISTAPVGTYILVYLPPQAAHQVPWWVQAIKTDGDLYDETGSVVDCATHWLPLPEPPTPKQAYVFLEEGDIIEDGDEFLESRGRWCSAAAIGETVTVDYPMYRRKLPTPNPES